MPRNKPKTTPNASRITSLLRMVEAGETITADDTNKAREAVNALIRSVAAPSQIFLGPSRGLIQMIIADVSEDDYLICNTWDGTTQGTIPIVVAKPYLLRNLAAWNGMTYTYSDSQTREADDGADTEDQVVVPAYVVDDIIYCQATNFTNIGDGVTTDMKLVDCNLDGRAWAKVDA